MNPAPGRPAGTRNMTPEQAAAKTAVTATAAGQAEDQGRGTVYLLHLDRRYKHAAHYLGYTTDLQARLAEHEAGRGARLLQVVKAAGISWTLARTWPGDRRRERQLKNQGGRSRMCPTCKSERQASPAGPASQAPGPNLRHEPQGSAEAGEAGDGAEFRAELPASLTAARQARSAVRRALAAWGMDSLTEDAELLASELVANAAEHGGGQPIALALRTQPGPAGQPGLMCEVTDSSPRMPQARDAGTSTERGRGLAIVAAVAEASGVTAGPAGKTAWFTLTAPGPAPQTRRAEAEAEAGG